MKYPVMYQNQAVGTVSIEEETYRVSWDAVCRVDTACILRLYAVKVGLEPLRIGVLEPDAENAGVLRLCRAIPRSELQAAGYDPLPQSYVLAENGRGLTEGKHDAHTGDAKLDALIDRGQARCYTEAGKACVCVPFEWGKACPMAFALTACRIWGGQAILEYRKEKQDK